MDKYEIFDFLKDDIQRDDIKSLRRKLIIIIQNDQDFSKGYFETACRYINKEDKIYEKLDKNVPLILNNKKDNFTKDDFIDAIYNLKQNFSRERVQEVKKIGKVIYRDETKKNYPPENMQKKTYTYSVSPKKKTKKKKGNLWITLIVVLIIGIVLGIGNIIKIFMQQDTTNQETQQDAINQEHLERE